MKVLLLQSYLGRNDLPVFPIGLAYISAALKKHQVACLDLNVTKDPFVEMERKIADFLPDVIGISLRNIDSADWKNPFYYFPIFESTIGMIKKAYPKIPIVVGGPGFSIFAEKIMLRVPLIDFGVLLEGEESFPELLNNLQDPSLVKGIYYRKDGKALFTGPRMQIDFGNSPVKPVRDLFELDKYDKLESIGVQSKRGCRLNCAYCNYPFLSGNTMRLRSAKDVVDEIEELATQRNITRIMFVDTVFNIPKKHAIDICRELLKRNVKVKWTAYFSESSIDKEFLSLATESGCEMFFLSPDGYSEEALTKLRKPFSKKDVKRVYSLATDLKGVKLDFGFFLDPPGQSFFSFLGLLWLSLKTNYLLPRKKFMHVGISKIRLLPHTYLYDYAIQEQSIGNDVSLLPLTTDLLPSVFYQNPNAKIINVLFILLKRIKHVLKRAKLALKEVSHK